MMSELHRAQFNKDTEELFLQLSKTAKSDNELYVCLLCRDTGWLITEQGAHPCSCTRENRLLMQRRQAGLKPAMDKMRFANFDLRYYEPDRQIKPGCSYRQVAEKALRAAKAFVAVCLRRENPRGLLFEGVLGSGKTFLAAAIASELLDRGLEARFIVVPEFLEQLRFSYSAQESNESEIMRAAMTVPVLVLDDIGAHNATPWTVTKMYTLLNYRLNGHLPCIITSNLKPAAMVEELGQRVASRVMEMCDRYILLTSGDIRIRKEGASNGWQV
jgi:DNA replication protein DnaC